MAARPYFPPYSVVTNGDMSATIISAVTNIQQIPYISYSAVYTGSPTGTFTVEVTNDYSLNPAGGVENPGNWTAITLIPDAVATGSAGNNFIDVRGTAASWIRLVYTPSSGSGSLTATIAGKVV